MNDWPHTAEKSNSSCDLPAILEHEVHVWSFDLRTVETELLERANFLSPDELLRASKFRLLRDSQRFSSIRSALRLVLGRYLDCAPNRISFDYSASGKPSLDDMHYKSKLMFNVSHSDDMAILAFAQDRALGVDIERVRGDFEEKVIAERFFSEAEKRDLFSLSKTERRRAFFDCWTRKEAYVKAQGQGLGLCLKSFDVSLKPSEPPEIRASRPNPTEAFRWSILLPPVPKEYSAALVIEGKDCLLRFYQLSNCFELTGSGH